jgi:HTH-type transcriptional regulator / antitoxin HigA
MSKSEIELFPMAQNLFRVPPGETIQEFLDYEDMAAAALGLGLSDEDTDRLLSGDLPLTTMIAERLEAATGIRAEMWNRLESNYRAALKQPE